MKIVYMSWYIWNSKRTLDLFNNVSQYWQHMAVKNALDSRFDVSSSTECMIKYLEIGLINTNSTFAGQDLWKQVGLQ